MVVLMTAASCLNKDPHTNVYEKEAWITFTKTLMQMLMYRSMLQIMSFEYMYLNFESLVTLLQYCHNPHSVQAWDFRCHPHLSKQNHKIDYN